MIRSTKFAVAIAVLLFVPILAAVTPALATTNIDHVVQLGDSYSAGYGVLAADRSASEGSCLEPGFFDVSATPGGRLAAERGASLSFQACGGAQILNVVEQFRTARSSIHGDGSGTLVVLTAGGNDVLSERGEGWTDLLQRCILRDFSCEQRSLNRVANFDEVADAMAALVDEIAVTAPEAQIRVLGYPELFQRTPGCWGVTGVDRNEADYLDLLARDLNDALKSAVTSVAANQGGDIAWVDVEDAFDDQGACQTQRSGERFVNDTEFVPRSLTVASNSFHPTAAGYDAYSQMLNASL